jgi:hypothetical protein
MMCQQNADEETRERKQIEGNRRRAGSEDGIKRKSARRSGKESKYAVLGEIQRSEPKIVKTTPSSKKKGFLRPP